jgi:hypothetical protein
LIDPGLNTAKLSLNKSATISVMAQDISVQIQNLPRLTPVDFRVPNKPFTQVVSKALHLVYRLLARHLSVVEACLPMVKTSLPPLELRRMQEQR